MIKHNKPRRGPIRAAIISEGQRAGWVWVLDRSEIETPIKAKGFTTPRGKKPWERIPGAMSLRRRATIGQFERLAEKKPFDVVFSHGPVSTFWTANAMAKLRRRDKKNAAYHVAYSFNFTDLPTGLRLNLFRNAFKHVDIFVVYTIAEKALYAEHFDIPIAKIVRAPWGVTPPIQGEFPRQIERPYFAALGGEARDYETLCRAAALCPETLFVCIARAWNFAGIEPPKNMRVVFNLPFQEAWAIVKNAAGAIVPLNSRETPCGLVTVVGAMHLGKAQIVTNAAGVSDYIRDGETGIMVPPKSPWAIANAVKRLQDQPDFTAVLGRNAQTFAAANCSEAATLSFVNGLLNAHFKP